MQNLSGVSIHSRQRFHGALLAFCVIISLSLAGVFFSRFGVIRFATVVSLAGSVLFFVAFFALTNKNYKLYAQGAMIGWGVYFATVMAISFFSRIVS